MSISRSRPLAAALILAALAGSARGDDVAAGIAARLRDSGALQGYRVNVKAKSGTVWLEGTVSDEEQLTAALRIAEESPGVERVVNRLAIGGTKATATTPFGMPGSILALAGGAPAAADTDAENAVVVPEAMPEAAQQRVELVQATAPAPRARKPQATASRTRRPAMPVGRPAQAAQRPRTPRGVVQVGGMVDEPMTLPMPDGYAGEVVGERIVPGTMQYDGGHPGMGGGHPGMGGGPMPMGGAGVGMPPVPMRGDGPNMPNYAWPSYAAYPNYAALQYPTQYSPTAWPYIGPFYPYPQVPLGWRRVSLEWDDGWWWLDFDDRHIHSHHR